MAADLSQLSDADLQALMGGQPSAAPAAGVNPPMVGGPSTPSPLQSMSDEEFMQHYANSAPQMTGIAREVALPASNVAKGALASIGMPGTLAQVLINGYSKYIGAPV